MDLTVNDLAAKFAHTAELLGHYDPRPILDGIREKLVDSVQSNFAGVHAPDGTPWKPILDPSHRPLVQSGDLMLAAVEAAWHSAAPDGGIAIDLGLLPSYGILQQDGTRTIPARPFIGIPDSVIAAAEDALVEDVLQKMLPG